MSIIRHGHMQQLECNECGYTYPRDYHRDDFDVMIADAKDDDWLIIREDDEWQHICPDCQ